MSAAFSQIGTDLMMGRRREIIPVKYAENESGCELTILKREPKGRCRIS
ncbi:MAG: hypothetical protein ACR2IB_00325 [Pyrinomonadaceae bacterium]